MLGCTTQLDFHSQAACGSIRLSAVTYNVIDTCWFSSQRNHNKVCIDESISVADLGFHEGGFVRSGALARPRKF